MKAELEELRTVKVDLEALRDRIRWMRDQRGDSACWRDVEKIYEMLPEGYTPPERDVALEISNCLRFIAAQRDNPRTVYISPNVRIEELERELATQKQLVAQLHKTIAGFAERIVAQSELLSARAEKGSLAPCPTCGSCDVSRINSVSGSGFSCNVCGNVWSIE